MHAPDPGAGYGGVFDKDTHPARRADPYLNAPGSPALTSGFMKFLPTPIRHRLEYAGFLCLVAIARAMPLEFASRTSGRLWRLFAPMLRRHKRAHEAIARCFPNQSEDWYAARLDEMWDNLGRVFAESFHLDEIGASGRMELENIDEIRAVLAGRNQFVVAGVHLGNWEIGARIAGLLGASACGIYQPMHNPLIENYIRSMREPLYPAGIFPKQNNAARQVMRAMRKGATLMTMGDLRDWSGPSVEFFGRPAPSNTFPALMARTHSLPLFAGMVARTSESGPRLRFRLRLVQIAMPQTEDRDADVLAATAALQAQFEAFIREYPGQWMWAHRRWG
ncbi:MAG: hypothetical protein KDJ29_00975 [Hyphomicrobiales bacterium]|nr:hypothetical protein [Hyphomicrobiales bacterium]